MGACPTPTTSSTARICTLGGREEKAGGGGEEGRGGSSAEARRGGTCEGRCRGAPLASPLYSPYGLVWLGDGRYEPAASKGRMGSTEQTYAF